MFGNPKHCYQLPHRNEFLPRTTPRADIAVLPVTVITPLRSAKDIYKWFFFSPLLTFHQHLANVSTALIRSTDIVSLIRDTDAHERALFTVPSSTSISTTTTAAQNDKKGRASIAPRRNTAVYSVLGGDMVEKLRRGGAGGVGRGVGGIPIAGGDVDVEVLLMGAERLGGV